VAKTETEAGNKTNYLYSAHRAVIFAIAQLSCLPGRWDLVY